MPSSIHQELHDISGVQILKAKGQELQLEVDTSCSPLEPILAAIMQRCHILDMTITDPPMEEIIAAIYSEQRQEEEDVYAIYTGEHGDNTTMAAISTDEPEERQKSVQDTTKGEGTTHEEETMLSSAANVKQLQKETESERW